MTGPVRIGIFGGTFDPFHVGHLAVARAALSTLALDEVHIVPASIPPHRPVQPRASAYHRFAMVALGIASEPGLLVDDLELAETGPSYTSNTLARFHERGLSPSQLFFIIGSDAFAEIATWHQYPQVLDQAHFVVVARPGRPIPELRAALPQLAPRMTDARAGSGNVDLRHPLILLVDTPTPDVSATSVRQALVAGHSLAGLVPTGVAEHIARHRLYETGSAGASPAAGSSKAASQLHEQEHV